jgi:hypothetical protein
MTCICFKTVQFIHNFRAFLLLSPKVYLLVRVLFLHLESAYERKYISYCHSDKTGLFCLAWWTLGIDTILFFIIDIIWLCVNTFPLPTDRLMGTYIDLEPRPLWTVFHNNYCVAISIVCSSGSFLKLQFLSSRLRII